MSDSRRSRKRKKVTRSRARLRVWGVINVAILLVFTGWVFRNADQTQARAAAAKAAVSASASATKSATATATASASASTSTSTTSIPTKAQILALSGKYFGVTALNVPSSTSAYEAIAKKAGVAPNMVEYYVNWTHSYDATVVRDAYAEGALPVLTWQSFAGLQGSTARTLDQSAYTLATIIDGDHDAYITTFAKAVKAAQYPIVIRLDHEMDGNWFPWSEGVNGNTSGQYVEAWRHIWTLFQEAGATNVIWDWAPNILRGATNTDLAELYPGDKYVDWIGLSAYDDTEYTAKALILPSLDAIREFTQRPLLITETGAEPGEQKTAFTENFLSWLPTRSDVIGFIWNEITKAQGSSADWGFDADTSTLAAFQSGIKSLTLAKIPAA